MKPNSVRVVVFRDGDLFVAQGLELDLAAQGKTQEEALERLRVVFRAEAREAAEQGRDLSHIGPAPAPFRALFENQVVSREELAA